MSQSAVEYKASHLMAARTAREINDGETAMIGIGLPLIAGIIARESHAPSSMILFEGGTVGAKSRRMPWSISDSATSDFALAAMELWRMLGDLQAGYIDVGVVGGAQVDRYGNLNSTAILGEGTLANPKVRMPGSGGANDIASSCGRTIIMMRLGKKNFVSKLDYMTSPGFLTGGDSRQRANLLGGGPEVVVTDKGVFRFDEQDKQMYLAEIDDPANLEAVRALVGWPLKVSPHLKRMQPPTVKEMEIMRQLDPMGLVLGSGAELQLDDFEKFLGMLEKNISGDGLSG
ncbi:MAG: glutaconate CoA-transferase [Proteobacteria bacterium]|nr:glutaconate CoA-transferase [Pseudomonadota bacterium]MBU4384737.1 glutaconate CoA-transferase [Pseudomonadota bacterium]MCG2764047.1 hypothetical protein [Desulfarculaceae bacterium]